MSDLPSVKQKIQTESTRYRSAVSEFFAQTLGKSINFLIDKYDSIFLANNVRSIDVVNVTTTGTYISYTVPSGKTFIGIAFVEDGDGSSFQINGNQVLGSFELVATYPLIANGGDLIEIYSTSHTQLLIRGIIISSSGLT